MNKDELRIVEIELDADCARRLDKALADAAPAELALSRTRIGALMREGCVENADGKVISNPSATPSSTHFRIRMPALVSDDATPEEMPLDIVFEDNDLLVVNKPAGMVVHPGAGVNSGTLVNGLLHHCGAALSGIGGTARPGIVHRIDKDTSGLLVVAKSDRAHQGLSAQFAAHTAQRRYQAVTIGIPELSDPRIMRLEGVSGEPQGIIRISAPLGRHPKDRKRMAVAEGGRRAVTRFRIEERFAGAAALISCRLETGRTHQIRVHLAHIGHPLLGDQTYARGKTLPQSLRAMDAAVDAFQRQALHAAELGFVHPVTGAEHRFSTPMPADMAALVKALRRSE